MCSCGNTETHYIAKRTTFDGKEVRFFSDMTIGLGFWGCAIEGIGRKVLSSDRLDVLKDEVALFTMPELVQRFNELHKMDAADKRAAKKAH